MLPQRHPNLAPVLCKATKLDAVSHHCYRMDYQKQTITEGKPIVLPADVVAHRLGTLLAMGIQALAEPEGGHDPFSISTHRRKIGWIDHAWIDAGFLFCSGFIYGHDFPDALEKIKEGGLGCCPQWLFVNEEDAGEHAIVRDLIFTGLNILDREKCGFPQTNIRLLSWEEHEALCQRK